MYNANASSNAFESNSINSGCNNVMLHDMCYMMVIWSIMEKSNVC